MTDIEFIQALRAVAKKYEGKPVATFETNISNMATDAADRIERLCDEINRQKAENERKDRILESYALQYGTVTDKEVFLKQAIAEAVKEFAERLKKEIEFSDTITKVERHIDNLVKEMTEETP